MAKNDTLRKVLSLGVIPVVRASSSEAALRAVDALREGGIDVIELTMTVPGALELIESLVHRFGSTVAVGAGTVLDAETARACVLSGAAFLVSPSVDRGMIACARTYGVPVVPGALTPTEIVDAWRAGADLVKVFPCASLGGASYVKALRGPLPQIDLVATGGVSLETAGDFVRAGAAAIGAGGDLFDAARGEGVSARARKYVQAIKEARAEVERARFEAGA
jgi:2-dehydro-3-deoxyphosphogluconate aldolase/(4S)-4-hydroxy-2-oxoglutarate aldolase